MSIDRSTCRDRLVAAVKAVSAAHPDLMRAHAALSHASAQDTP
jgi:hypothetical protein